MKNSESITNVLNKEGFIIYPIKGISMYPLLVQNEDSVRIKKIDNKPNLYDVVLFRRNKNSYVLHRVVKLEKKYAIIVGDNQKQAELIKYKDILGVMEGYYKGTSYISTDSITYKEYLNKNIINIDYKNRNRITPFIKMPNTYRYILDVIRSYSINNSVAKLDYQIDENKLLLISKSHSIAPFIFKGLDKDKISDSIYNEFKKEYNKTIEKHILFKNERDNIYSLFNKEKIPYIPLKGIITNTLYPEPYLRVFADNDILINPSDNKKVKDIFISLGYKVISFNKHVHDTYNKEPVYNFEIHRKLFNENMSYHNYFNSLYKKAIKKNDDTYEYIFNDNDFFLYNIAHLNKHNMNGGTGLRSLIDIYYLKTKLNLDFDYINKELKKTSLDDFYNSIDYLVNELFNTNNELNYYDFKYLFESSTYGSLSHSVLRGYKNKGNSKFKYILSRAFLPYNTLKNSYPILVKIKILYPVLVIYRLISLPFKKESKEHLRKELKALNNIDK